MNYPDAILAADLHLGEKQPPCRLDDFEAAQRRKLEWLASLAKEHDVPVIVAGDWFDKSSGTLLSIIHALYALPRPDEYGEWCLGVAGQHDLASHNIANLGHSALAVLIEAERVRLLSSQKPIVKGFEGQRRVAIAGASWGEPLPTKGDIAVLHRYTYVGRSPWPGCPAEARASWLMSSIPHRLVVTGDNHIPFVYKHRDGRLLVNPGSMMRRRADQIDHRPRVYLWYAKDNRVEPKFYPIEKGVVTREHIDPKKERDDRISEFIARLDREYEVGLSFEKNMDEFLEVNKIAKTIRRIIYDAVTE